MTYGVTMAETARKIIADLSNEREQIATSIESTQLKLETLKTKLTDIDSAITILADTYKVKSRPADVEVAKPAPLKRGRKKNTDPKNKPIEIKAAVRDYIAGNLDFPVKALVAAVRQVRPDAQQPSIQAELTKLMKAGELARIGYGQYRSNVYSAGTDSADSAPEIVATAE